VVFFGFVNNFFSFLREGDFLALTEPTKNGAMSRRKFDNVFRGGSGNDLENAAISGASLARFPSRVAIFASVNDDRGPAIIFRSGPIEFVFHSSENDRNFREVKFFFELFFGAWNIRNVVEHFCGTFFSAWNISLWFEISFCTEAPGLARNPCLVHLVVIFIIGDFYPY